MELPRILVLEDQPDMQSLIAAMLKVRGLACDTAKSLAEGRALAGRFRYDVLFLDVNLPDGCGLSLAEECTNQPLVVVITARDDIQIAIRAIRNGTFDLINKPFSAGVFLQRLDLIMQEWRNRTRVRGYARALENLVVLKTNELSQTSRKLSEVRDATVAALRGALHLKDHETSDHCARVSRNSVRLGRSLSLSTLELQNLRWGASLHDLGKIGIPEHILLKSGELTPQERAIVEKHPYLGWTLLSGIEFLRPATDVVLSHHERFDGTGYPNRIAGTDIPLNARIFAVVDALDAMTSARPYRPPVSFAEACQELEQQTGRQFDPEIIAKFLNTPPSTWLIQDRRVHATT